MKKYKSGYQGAKGGGKLDPAIQKYIRFMIIPAVAVVLILLIVFADGRRKGVDENPPDVLGEAQDKDHEPVDLSKYGLKVNDVPEIQILMEDYYQAKLEGDAETVGRLFGKTDPEEIESYRPALQLYEEMVESFDDITCYYKPGVETDSYMVYVYCNIRMKKAETPGPSFLWTYVKRGDDGEYRMWDLADLTPEERAYAEEVDKSEDVRSLSAQAAQKLQGALKADQNLAYYYGRLCEGSPVYEAEEETPEAVSQENQEGQDSGETSESAPSESGAAESEAGSQEQGGEPSSSAGESQETAAETAA